MKLALTALLLALTTSTAAVAQELEFRSVTVTKEFAGARKGRQVTLTLEGNGAVNVHARGADGKVSATSGLATLAELTAARRAYRAAHVDTLPQHILEFDATTVDEDAEEGTVRLQSVLPDGRATSTTADLGRYDSYAPRIEPVLAALDAIGKRLVGRARLGFQQVTLVTRATGGPTPGATSSFGLQSTGRARLERRLPGAQPSLAEGQATPDELKRLAAALDAAASVPAGQLDDPRGESTAQVILVLVGADGTTRTITARRGAYGDHPALGGVVDALEAIARRLAASAPPVTTTTTPGAGLGGALGGLSRGLTGALTGR